jgi:hypothetical protein
MMFHDLVGSLTEEYEREIKTCPSLYTLNIARVSDMSGLLYLKLILSRAQTDTIATVDLLRRKVASLGDKMV